MKISAAPVLLTSVLCLAALEARADRFLFSERQWGDCVVVTDMTDAGRAFRPAGREHPVYFLGEVYGGRLGSMHGDELPDPKEMSRFVAKVLAKQGYLGAQPGVHDPELFLVVQWGRLDRRTGDGLWFLGYNPRQDPAARVSWASRITSAGFTHFGPEIYREEFRPREIETVLEYAEDDIYGFIISAFEYKTARTAEPVVLWQTRIGLPANGKSMDDALTTIVRLAAAQIGRETTRPVLTRTDDRYTTRLGELEILGVEEDQRQ
jgi:hypothetical protein